MNTKTCKHCGWVYPITQPGRNCIICGQPFEVVTCSSCGTPTPAKELSGETLWCKACVNRRDVAGKHRRMQARVDRFDEWLAKIAAVPADYPTLTEEQWLEACTFFNGCARCYSKDIDTRGFFVGAKLGGRYCDWNIIPLCEKCATNWDLDRSVFKYVYNRDNSKRSRESRDCLEKIIHYLGGKLDAATEATK